VVAVRSNPMIAASRGRAGRSALVRAVGVFDVLSPRSPALAEIIANS
jgi:hypothetical protein